MNRFIAAVVGIFWLVTPASASSLEDMFLQQEVVHVLHDSTLAGEAGTVDKHTRLMLGFATDLLLHAPIRNSCDGVVMYTFEVDQSNDMYRTVILYVPDDGPRELLIVSSMREFDTCVPSYVDIVPFIKNFSRSFHLQFDFNIRTHKVEYSVWHTAKEYDTMTAMLGDVYFQMQVIGD